MLGMFCGTSVTSNEEYRKYVKKRIKVLSLLIVLGVLTMGVVFMAETIWNMELESYTLGLYSGFASGLIAAGIVLILKNRKLLKEEEKLRQARIAASDERNQQISTQASKIAIAILLIAMYLIMLIGGFWYPILTKMMAFLVALYVFAYCVAYKIVSKKV